MNALNYNPFESGECAVLVEFGSIANFGDKRNAGVYWSDLPCYADEVSNSVEATWQETTIPGRTGSINVYNSTSDVRTTFSFDMHREMNVSSTQTSTENKIDYALKVMKSGVYPLYRPSGLQPPFTIFKFGNMIISGRLLSVQDTWKKPIVNGNYMVCSVSISMAHVIKQVIDATDIMYETNKVDSTPTPPDIA